MHTGIENPSDKRRLDQVYGLLPAVIKEPEPKPFQFVPKGSQLVRGRFFLHQIGRAASPKSILKG